MQGFEEWRDHTRKRYGTPEMDDTGLDILTAFRQGWKHAEIAPMLGVEIERVRQVISESAARTDIYNRRK